MILTTPFHERTAALNQTRLWEHWSNHLAARRYQLSDKAEYFAVRDSAGIFDTSPLFKYRVSGPDAERFLAGMLARDVRALRASGRPSTRCWLRRPRLRRRGRRGAAHGAGRVPPDERRAQPRVVRRPRRARGDVHLEDVSDA